MIDTDVTSNRGVDHTLGLKDPHTPTQESVGDHTQEIGDHLTEGENLHLTSKIGSLDRGPVPRTEAGILANWTVTPLPEDHHLNIIKDPTHQNTNVESIHAHQTLGEDIK